MNYIGIDVGVLGGHLENIFNDNLNIINIEKSEPLYNMHLDNIIGIFKISPSFASYI